MGIEITERQPFHMLEKLFAQAKLRALRHVNHQAVVTVRANDAQEQDEAEFEKGLQERRIFWIGDLRERHDIVVDEGSGEKRRGERGDGRHGDADENGENHPAIVLHHEAQQPQQRRFFRCVERGRKVFAHSWSVVSIEIWLSHIKISFRSSKSPVPTLCNSLISR